MRCHHFVIVSLFVFITATVAMAQVKPKGPIQPIPERKAESILGMTLKEAVLLSVPIYGR